MPVDDLNDLYLFGRVVEAGGFSAAERRTGIPKSRLSRRVSALEKQLEVRLIQRNAQRFQVTEAGERVYLHARRIAEEADAAAATAGEIRSEPAGLIRVSTSVLTGEMLLAGWIAQFMVLHPKVRVALDLTNRFVDLVGERIDLAIRYSSAPLASSELIARSIGASRMVLVASPALIATLGEPEDLPDLSRFPALAQGSLESLRPWGFRAADGSAVSYTPEPRLVTDNILALREAAVQGAGIVQLPFEACREALGNGSLKSILEHRASLETPVYAVYPSRHGMPLGVRMLVAFLEERFRAER